MLYQWMLIIHNLLRWAVLLALVWALYRAYSGWIKGRGWSDADRRAGMLLTIGYDLQFLVGLILAFQSPIVAQAFTDLGAAMQIDVLRFFAVEHMPMMLLALIIGHVTSSLSRKATADSKKHRLAALGFTLVALITIAAMPWFRPLLPF